MKASVKDKAEELIKPTELSDTNYTIAWNALCERYDDLMQLVHNHIKALYNIKPIMKESPAKPLTIIDKVTKHLRALKILGKPTEHWDSLIVYHISIKLDNISSREWEKQKSMSQSKPSLSDVTKFIRACAQVLQILESQSKSEQG